MRWKRQVFAAAALALIPTGVFGADDQRAATEGWSATESSWQIAGDGPVFTDGMPRADGEPLFLTRGQSPNFYRRDVGVRFGWWITNTRGDLTKIDEWQRVEDSPFWDIDGLTSDADRTVNFTITGTHNEATDVGLNYFGPAMSADFDYQRFYHRLDHHPLTYFDDTDGDHSYIGVLDDVNAGEDYAMRIQKLDARFKGQLTENVKWGLNLWGLRKQGERQQNAMNHPCSDHQCHLQSARQRIDWLTMEIEPVVEVNLGPVTVEYSRTMRSFNQDDGTVSRSYTGRPVGLENPGDPQVYGVVPENFTQIDRLKLFTDLTENNQVYANLFIGNTENKHRSTNRNFSGVDVRLTNRSIEGLSVTGFFKEYQEDGQLPTTFPEDPIFDDDHKPSDDVRNIVDREVTKGGVKARWHPFRRRWSSSGLSLTGGYEYRQIERTNVTYTLNDDLASSTGFATWTQPTSVSNLFHVGVSERWSESLDSFVRFKTRVVDNPLYGFRENQERFTIDDAINTNQPEHEDLVEIGGTWTPAYNILVSATIGIQDRHTSSPYAYFDEDDYPIVVTAWYAPTTRWSLSAGYANFSNFIDQDVTLGIGHTSSRGDEDTDTTRWSYRGRSDVFNLGASYAASERLTLSGSLEYVRGQNIFNDPSFPGLDVSYLPGASDVLVETWRLAAGVDYWLVDGVSCYFHYNYFDYDDKSVDFNSGTANMFLVGMTAVR